MSIQQVLLEIEKTVSEVDAWFAGYSECHRGFSPDANPYETPALRLAWRDGYQDALQERTGCHG